MAHSMDVRLNDFQRQWRAIGPAALRALNRVGGSGWYVLGREVEAFEAALAARWGLEHAVGVASGLDAIEIALRGLGIGPGDRVLTTPMTAFATTLAVLKVGAVPVYVDTDRRGLLDLDRCRRALEGGGFRCLLPVHLYGHCLDLEALRELRERHGVALVEDCAQSIGARWRGVPAGTAGEAAATSFYPTKNLGALGDGGALLTDSAELARRARALRNYGQSRLYVHELVGLNSRLDEVHAAILADALLPRLAEWEARRREIAGRYCRELASPHLEVLGAPAGSDSVWHLFPVLVAPAARDAFRRFLAGAGVATGVHYPCAVPDQPAMRSRPCEALDGLENARRIAAGEVSLPIHPFLAEEEIEYVIATCNRWEGP
jgi:dTDP-4-amino-4,6-dideoxygalactose transaminase